MTKEELAALQSAISDVEVRHPALYAVLHNLADELADAEIDPESTLASPASKLVTAFGD